MTHDDRSFRPDANPSPSERASRLTPYAVTAVVSMLLGVAIAFLWFRSTKPPPPIAQGAPSGLSGTPKMENGSTSKRPPAGGANAAYISPQRQQLIGVRTAAIGQQQLDTTIRTVGTIAYDETRVAEIHTKFSGWIDRVYVDSVGKPVRRNEPLITVYSPELVSTEHEYLLALKYKTQLEGSSVPATRAAAESLLEAAHDRLRLWDIPEEHIKELKQTGQVRRALMLHSPFAGVVLERKAFPGQYVTPDMALFRIADLAKIWVLGSVFEYELRLVKVGQDAEVRFPNGEATSTLKGKITFIYPDIDPQTRRARVRAEFPNPGLRLKPETYVTVLIRTGGGRELAIPKEAVIDTGTKRYALLALPRGYFEPREIQVGEQSNDFYRLIGGLREGDRIVTSAQFLVDSESNLKAAMQSMAAMPGMDVKPAGGDMKGTDMPAQPPPTPTLQR